MLDFIVGHRASYMVEPIYRMLLFTPLRYYEHKGRETRLNLTVHRPASSGTVGCDKLHGCLLTR